MELFAPGSPEFSRLIQQMAAKAADVDFFDKLLRDHMLDSLQKERLGQEDFRYKAGRRPITAWQPGEKGCGLSLPGLWALRHTVWRKLL
ncbi:Uncharacterised protein [Mycobacteroides abscessus subsp. abscessus]|nr:Uncharacterised protein [Mycobacteroides abscessus subsp. abscessus]